MTQFNTTPCCAECATEPPPETSLTGWIGLPDGRIVCPACISTGWVQSALRRYDRKQQRRERRK